jgi:hypothetical protein
MFSIPPVNKGVQVLCSGIKKLYTSVLPSSANRVWKWVNFTIASLPFTDCMLIGLDGQCTIHEGGNYWVLILQ